MTPPRGIIAFVSAASTVYQGPWSIRVLPPQRVSFITEGITWSVRIRQRNTFVLTSDVLRVIPVQRDGVLRVFPAPREGVRGSFSPRIC